MTPLKTIRVGRGLGLTELPLVDLIMGRGVWHIDGGEGPLCRSLKHTYQLEQGVDAKVVAHKGKAVCAKCRERLGSVPMPRLVREPI